MTKKENIILTHPFVLTLCFLITFNAHFVANATTFNQNKLNKIIVATQEAVNIKDFSVVSILFAKGVQSYELKEKGWVAAGPLAKLFSVNNGVIGNEKIGTHYLHLHKPAWEILAGRVIAKSATVISKKTINGIKIGANDNDVPWLSVVLQKNELGFDRILRIVTVSGKPPLDVDNYKLGAFTGIGYTTYYVFLKK